MAEQTEWTFQPSELDKLLSSFGHNILLGHRYHAHAHGPDWVELAMPWQEDLVGDEASGALAHGPLFALLDNAAGTACWLRRGGFLPQVTIDLRVDHIRPTTRGATVISRCECYEMTQSIAYVRGIAYDQAPDDLVCHVTGTFMLLEGESL